MSTLTIVNGWRLVYNCGICLCYSFVKGILTIKSLLGVKLAGADRHGLPLFEWLKTVVVAGGMVILTGCVLGQPRSKNALPLSAYTNRAGGYRIDFPSSWNSGDLDHGKVSKSKNGTFIGSLTIATTLKTKKKFDDYIDQDLKPRVSRAGSKYQQFETVTESRTTLQGKPAFYLEIVTEQEGDTHADHTVLLYVDRGNGSLAALVMGVNEGEWEKNPGGYRRVVGSFKLL